MRNFKNYFLLLMVLAPLILLFLGGLGAFGTSCQQFTVDVIYDIRSYHVIQH